MAETTEKLLRQMTVEEKAAFASGVDMWNTAECKRLGIKSITMCDGPHGLHKQNDLSDTLSSYDSIKTVSYPSGSCMASSWDPELFAKLGRALGETAAAHGVSLLLGPAINIKRSPLGGRNFEYFSEDPYLTAELAAAYTTALQETGVSAVVKHFAANSQEKWRLTVDERIDERVLRELYFPAFEKQVKDARVDAVMSAYNQINGSSCSENPWLLKKVLREEWGFTGMVVSDWGAVKDQIASIKAGNNLKMPGLSYERETERILKAIAQGRLSEAELDEGIRPVLDMLLRERDFTGRVCDEEKNHEVAELIAQESMVLLKNEGALPLPRGRKLLILGEFASKGRHQGGGSSRINPYRVDNTLDSFAGGGWDYTYIPKFDDLEAIKQAAERADRVIVFAGLSDAEESEGFDRAHLDLAEEQNAAISALAKLRPPWWWCSTAAPRLPCPG
jgi:beta-glucosidase